MQNSMVGDANKVCVWFFYSLHSKGQCKVFLVKHYQGILGVKVGNPIPLVYTIFDLSCILIIHCIKANI